MQHYKNYFKEIKSTGTKGTEHTYRTNFENFLNAIKPDERVKIIHAPKRKQGFGAPDFRIEKETFKQIVNILWFTHQMEKFDKILREEL